MNIVAVLGTGLGSILGGSLADSFGWRATFFLQLPLITLSTLGLWWKVVVPESNDKEMTSSAGEKLKRIDWAGLLTVMIGVSSLMVSLSLFTSYGYPISSPLVYLTLLVSAVSIPILYVIETRAKEPIVPMDLLKKKDPLLILVGMFCYNYTSNARAYILPIYLKLVRSLSSQLTGEMTLPSVIAASFASLIAGWYMKKTKGYKKLQIAAGLISVASCFMVLDWSVDINLVRVTLEMTMGLFGPGIQITT
jgi:MFS family permease